MGLSWMSAIKLIPWVDVVQATPGIVRGARDLWSRTRGAKEAVATQAPPVNANDDLAQLGARIARLETEQLEASQLINTLAEQNAQLVATLDALRRRTRALTAFAVLLTVGLAATWLR